MNTMIEQMNILNKKTKSELIELLHQMELKICSSVLQKCYKQDLVQTVYDMKNGVQPYNYLKVLLSNSYK